MKKLILLIALLLITQSHTAFACDVCKKNQPKVLENITHGTGPTGILDYIIIWSAVLIVAITLFFSIKYLVRPAESRHDHIKHIVWGENS